MKTNVANGQGCKTNQRGFTLIELLIVVAIIGTLTAILLPVIGFVQYQSQATDASATIKTVHMALEQIKQKTGQPLYPDNPPNIADRYVGFMKYLPNETSITDRGLLSVLANKDLFTPTTEVVDENGLMLDPWGEPFHYVKGNFENRKTKPTYDATLPQDTNKPKDATLAPEDSDWNIDDKGGFTYIYSAGGSDSDADWIYIKDLRGDY